ncbi:non-ribosomal peptide synthetase [Paraburkholderia bannensis]|uniref:non-ribosomal peptide synthetase n=1 Tax=Paraburkholderia bannensis TaxID=765414 RepID=UPI00048981C5|nr:non-ribosomal peptide synthetase [Paraburkholderia bannensis]
MPLSDNSRADDAARAAVAADAVQAPARDLVSALQVHLKQRPQQTAVRLLVDGDTNVEALSYAQLDARARALAQRLRAAAPAGERVLILLPTSLDYVVAFLACQYAGQIAVPAYPPEAGQGAHGARLRAMAADCRPAIALVAAAGSALIDVAGLRDALADTQLIDPQQANEAQEAHDSGFCIEQGDPEALAFLQYTSGSTSSPKGVMVTHGNLCANIDAIAQSMAYTAADRMLSWLPLYHDMGLIGGLLSPLVCGFPVTLMTPQHFLERPARWLAAVARERASVSGGPDFAYRLCLDRVRDAQLGGLDLGSWRVAFCGAEPIRQATLDGFAARFAPCGFDAAALYPCYGLAEATLLVTGVRAGGGAPQRRFLAAALAEGQAREFAPEHEQTQDAADLQAIVDCGVHAAQHALAIVDPRTLELRGEGVIGEIWVQGPSIAQGYWRNAQASDATFVAHPTLGGRWLRTGDLGFLVDGRLHVCGRAKDLIVIHGQNLYPQDIEASVGDALDWVRRGRVSAFPVVRADGGEGIGLAAEVARGKRREAGAQALFAELQRVVGECFQQEVTLALLLEPGDLPRTSSGKLQRSACLPQWNAGTLTPFAVLDARSANAGDQLADGPPRHAEIEARVAQCWRTALPATSDSQADADSPFDADTDFFAAGGQSIAAVRLAAALGEAFGVTVPVGAVFVRRTVRAQAAMLADEFGVSDGASAVARQPVAPDASPGDATISAGQRALWFLWRVDPNDPAWHVSATLELNGALRTDALRHALALTLARHPELRARFDERDGLPVRSVVQDAAVEWQALDSANAALADAHATLAAAAARPFDLTRGPLLRATLVRLDAQRYRLGLVTHHIVCDAASWHLVCRDLLTAYETALDASDTSSTSLDFAADFPAGAAVAAGVDLDAQRAYWRERLGTSHPRMVLPEETGAAPLQASQAAQPQTHGHGARVARSLSDALTAKLADWSHAQGATAFAGLFTGFVALLHRLNDQPDLRIGMPVSLREAATHRRVGYLVNSAVVRVQADARMSVDALLAQVGARVIEALGHRELPFAEVVDLLSPTRDAAATPLFNVMFNEQIVPAGVWRAGALEVEAVEEPWGSAQFDLTLNVVRSGASVRVLLDYRAGRLSTPAAQRLLDQYVAVLEAIAATNATNALTLADLLPDDGAQASGDAVLREPQFVPVHRRFARMAQQTPEACAVVCDGDALSYAELARWSNRIARVLQHRGARADECVGVCVGRSTALIAAGLGVFAAGAAYLPLDPDYPAQRISAMLRDARVRYCVADVEGAARLREIGADLVLIDAAALRANDAGNANEANEANDNVCDALAYTAIDAAHTAYVIYTSGSTGAPKGVALPHGAFDGLMQTMREALELTPADTWLAATSASFDISLLELFLPLTVGAQIELASRETQRDGERLAALLDASGATVFQATPTGWKLLLAGGWRGAGARQGARLQGLSGGEALPADLAGALIERGVDLWNLYGPTETTIYSLGARVAADRSVTIGQALARNRLRVLSRAGEAVPAGGIGELCIGGDNLARGYLGRAAQTAERFVPDSAGHGARLYRTGDLCRVDSDGRIAYLGRLDQQIKLRGHRIEPGEIETVLRRCAGVRDAAVVLREDDAPARLVGYVAADAGADAANPGAQLRAELRAELQRRLPPYMVPAALVVLPALPLTPSGKIDRRALPAPALADGDAPAHAADIDHADVVPGSPLARLLDIWASVLGLSSVAPSDDFFQLGGDSILTLQIVSRAREAGLRVTPRQVFEHPTPAALAAIVATQSAALAPGAAAVHGALPLTPIQHAFFETFPHGEPHWNQAVLLEPGRALTAARLERALRALRARHEALRLRFERRADGGWQQEVVPLAAFDAQPVLTHVEVAHAHDWDARLAAACDAVQRGFDLAGGRLFAAALVEQPQGGRRRLLLAAHHLAVDGVSWRVIVADLERLLACADQAEAAIDANAVPVPWSAWVEAQRRYADALDLTHEATLWQDAEAVIAAGSGLPFAQGHHANQPPRTLAWSWDAQSTQRLIDAAPRALRLRADEVLLAALVRTLHGWSGGNGCTRHAIELEGHGRAPLDGDLDTSATVGWFTTRYPVVLSAHDDALATLRAVKTSLRAVHEGGLHYGMLRRAQQSASHPAIAFNYLGRFEHENVDLANAPADAAQRLAFTHEAPGAMRAVAPARYALDINAMIVNGVLSLTWDTDPARVPEATAAALLDAFGAQLDALVRQCESAHAQDAAFQPADFPDAQLNAAQLAQLALDPVTTEDVYAATELQQGLLIHSLSRRDESLYVNQMCLTLAGGVAEATLRAAWQAAIARHPVLRTGFRWLGTDAALQIVVRAAALPWQAHDWSALDAQDYAARLAAWRDADERTPFDMAQAPLMRVALFARPDGRQDLVWTHHHAILDGWSASKLLADVLQACRAQTTQTAAPDSAWRGYIAWLQRRGAQSATSSTSATPSAESWWRAQLARADEPARLVESLGAPLAPRDGIGRHTLALDAATRTRLLAGAQRQRVTPGTLAHAAWACVLARAGYRRQAVFGTAMAGRPATLRGAQQAVGLFINSLPLWIDVPGRTPATQWLQAVQQQVAALREHETTSLAQVQRWAAQGNEALFDTLLAVENYPVDAALRDGAAGAPWVAGVDVRERPHFPLTVSFVMGAVIEIQCNWDERLFDRVTVERLIGDFATLTGRLADARDESLAQLVPAELGAQAEQPSHAAPETPFESVTQRIAVQALRRPHAEAVADAQRRIDYATLSAWSDRIAAQLAALGIGREDRVGVCMERSVGLVAALLGVLKAGAAYVPLDPAYPQERLLDVAADARLAALVGDESSLALLPAVFEGRACVMASACDPQHAAADSAAHADAPFVAAPVHPEQLAYVIYTSGSTGRPKGVAVTHRNVARLFDATRHWYAFDEHDVWPLFHAYAFDVSVWELFGALTHGGRLVVVPAQIARDAAAFHALLCREGVTVLNQTPSAFMPLMQADADAPTPLTRVRAIVFAGEKLEPGALARWYTARTRAGLPQPRIVNMYGITETTVHVTYRVLGEAEITAAVPRSLIGEPMRDLQLRLLDRDVNAAPVGGVGALYVGGPGVARGYLGRPGLTAERFVPDPHGAPGSRLYASGDLARGLPTGEPEYIGRSDFQVKIRGYRIEPGEVQAVLYGHPAVREAAVLAVPDNAGVGLRLVAWVVPDDVADVDMATLRDWVAQRMPAYMVPSAFVALDVLPLTVNGKLDRRALPAPESAQTAQTTGVAPRNDTERTIATVWAEVLRIDAPGVAGDFFALGGHSLLALRTMSRLRDAFGREVPLELLFSHPVLADLAAALDAHWQSAQHGQHGGARIDAAPALVARAGDAGLSAPLSLAQERLWFLWQLDPDSAAYNVSGALQCEGALDVDAVRAAFDALVARHAVLRTRFSGREDTPRQHALPAADASTAYRWDTFDASALDADTLRAQLIRNARAPFDLESGPLLRVTLARLAPQRHVLHLVLHHIVSDGWSIEVLLREFAALYRAARAGEQAGLPALPIQYADYASWQHDWLAQGGAATLERQLGYWRERLAGLRTLMDLPSAHDRSSAFRPDGARHLIRVPQRVCAQAEALALDEGATLFMVLLAAFDVLLYQYSGSADVPVAIPVAGRNRVETEGLIGFFVNTLVMRARISGADSFADLLHQVRADSIGAQGNSEVPFDRLVAELQPQRHTAGNPLTQVKFLYQDAFAAEQDLDGVRCELLDVDPGVVRFELALDVLRDARGLECVFAYALDVYDAEFVEQLARHYVSLLRRMVNEPTRAIGSFELDDDDFDAAFDADLDADLDAARTAANETY